MKRVLSTDGGSRDMLAKRICVLTENVWNIWNIDYFNYLDQQIQGVERENLFHLERNMLEQTGTNLFRHVPEMFHFSKKRSLAYSPSAARLTEDRTKIVFRHVPVCRNIDQLRAGHGRRGLRETAPSDVPVVPDVSGAYAVFASCAGGLQ